MQKLYELLHKCTVKLSILGQKHGTGFFVAPDFILTCAHVVKGGDKQCIKDDIEVKWQNQDYFAKAEDKYFFIDCDLALIKLTSSINSHPCVYLDELVEAYDQLYSYGYPDDFDQGAPVTFECEGITGDNPPFIKFKAGQARPGLSGSPLLNQPTGKVCGIVKFSRDRTSNLGGGGVIMTTVFSRFTELKEQNRQFHQKDTTWKDLIDSLDNPPQTPSKMKLSRQELEDLLEERDACYHQYRGTIDDAQRVRLKRKLDDLDKKIDDLQS